MKGLIIAGTNNLVTIECEDDVTRNCTIKGKVLKSDKRFYNPLAPGDVVEIEVDPINDEKGQIVSDSVYEYKLYVPKENYAEQDALEWKEGTILALNNLLIKANIY